MDNNNLADQQSTMVEPALFTEAIGAGLFLVPSDRCEVAGDGIVRVVEARCASCTQADCPLRGEMQRVRSLKSRAEASGPATARYEPRRQRLLASLRDVVAELEGTDDHDEAISLDGWNRVAQWVVADALAAGVPYRDVEAVVVGVALQLGAPRGWARSARDLAEMCARNEAKQMVDVCWIHLPDDGAAGVRAFAERLAEVLRRREAIDMYVGEFGLLLEVAAVTA